MTEGGRAVPRRTLIGLGAVAIGGLWLGVPALLPKPALPFEPVDGLPGFRRLPGGATSAASDPFIALATRTPEGLPPAAQIDDPCPLLGAADPGTVPVTLFTDVFCGVCRGFEPVLDARNGDTITLTRQPLPLLGAGSVAAARATLAAERQGAGDRLHARLMRSRFQPGPDYLAAVADGLGLDVDRLLADTQSAEITDRLSNAHGLADRFGLYATPAMIVGRTAVLGALEARTLDQLIAEESALPPVCG